MSEAPKTGTIGWLDLTVGEAEKVRDFYSAVVGWSHSPVDMDGYSDFVMLAPGSGQAVAGVCHARGVNEGLPPVWLVYLMVENVDESAKQVAALGGKVLVGPKDMGSHGRYAVIEDPAGAKCALFQAAG